jgi:hypothetical protein
VHLRSRQLFYSIQLAGIMYVEHGDAIFDGKYEAVMLTYQLITTSHA